AWARLKGSVLRYSSMCFSIQVHEHVCKPSEPAVARAAGLNVNRLADYRDRSSQSVARRDYLERDDFWEASLNYFSNSATKNFLHAFQRCYHVITTRTSLCFGPVSQRNARPAFLIVQREPKKQTAFKKLNVTDLPFVFHRSALTGFRRHT